MTEETLQRPMEILLVEDNPGDVDLVKSALRGFKIPSHLNVARDGVEALAMLYREKRYADCALPDLILLDLNLPRKNGHEVLAEIKQDRKLRRIPVIVVTSSQSEEDVLISHYLHANCYVTKPSGLNQFREAIRKIVDFWFTVANRPGCAC
jgi:two-component system, chemotaxis family, response regulator Rcp1